MRTCEQKPGTLAKSMADDSRESVKENTSEDVEGSGTDKDGDLVNNEESEETMKTFKDLVGKDLLLTRSSKRLVYPQLAKSS